MSSQYGNPYAPPQTPDYQAQDYQAPSEPGALPHEVVEPLRRTRPWVLFLAIVGFIASGLLGVLALATCAMGAASKTGISAAAGFFYLIMAATYVLPSLNLLHYASAITRLVRDPCMERLAVALGHQRSFWKVVGIIAAVVLALYPIAMVAAVVVYLAGAKG